MDNDENLIDISKYLPVKAPDHLKRRRDSLLARTKKVTIGVEKLKSNALNGIYFKNNKENIEAIHTLNAKIDSLLSLFRKKDTK